MVKNNVNINYKRMFFSKRTAVNIFIFATCLTTCLILFSLDNKHEVTIKQLYTRKSSSDNQKLFNLDLKYLINNHVCENNFDILAVMVVTSYYGDIETRSAMRRSFSNEKLKEMKLRRVFLIAIGPHNNKFDVSHEAIIHENNRFGDLIQGNFIEAYRNLTYKHVMGLKWASTYCKQAKYVIKMDDDIVLNMHELRNILTRIEFTDNNQLAGYIFRGMVPIREPANKWFVTKKEYSNSMYPPFLSGWFYVTTPTTARKLVEASSETPYFWIDDVYVTGILAKKLKITHYELKSIFAVHSEYLECCIRDNQKYNYSCDLLVGPNGGDNNLFYTFNEVMSKCAENKCVKRPEQKSINDTCVAERKILVGKGKALIETVHLF